MYRFIPRATRALAASLVTLAAATAAQPAAAATLVTAFDVSPNPSFKEYAVAPVGAWLGNDQFVAVWMRLGPGSTEQDGRYDLMLRRFAADGTPLMDELRIGSTHLSWSRDDVAVRVIDDGHFLVVWPDADPHYDVVEAFGGLDFDLYGQVFGFDGVPTSLRFPVDTVFAGRQIYPVILPLPNSRFAVVHAAQRNGLNDGRDLFAQRFGIDGKPLGAMVRVNAVSTGQQTRPAGDCDPRGRCLVAWGSFSDYDYLVPGQLKGQFFDALLTPVGSEFTIAAEEAGNFSFPRVAMDALGRAAVTWQTGNPATDLRLSLYRADHTVVKAGVVLTAVPDSFAQVVRRASGEIAMAWSEVVNGHSRVYLRDLTAAGGGVSKIKLADALESAEYLKTSNVMVNGNGRAVVFWRTYPVAADDFNAFMRGAIVDGVGVAPVAPGAPDTEPRAASVPTPARSPLVP
jgi:hypothetical protein